jgi:HPt (histidine-containing phosphotransfer) domain-containing protein
MEQPNIEYFIKLSNNNASFKQKLIEVVKYELPLEIEFYINCIKQDDWEKAAETVHKLRHKIGVLGMEKGYKVAEEYEKNLREGSKEMQSEFEQSLTIINQFVKLL